LIRSGQRAVEEHRLHACEIELLIRHVLTPLLSS
jgi:hypothetical protein